MTARAIITTIAAVYTLAGIGALVIGFVIPWDDPLAPVYAILLGAPWVQVLGRLDVFVDRPIGINIALVAGSIALNAGLLWWWALTRQRSSSERGGN
jgi:hypothetical protein